MISSIRSAITQAIAEAIPEISVEDIVLAVPPKRDMGDLGMPCFQLAKKLRLAPAEVAQIIEQKVVLPHPLQPARAVGPYINFSLNRCHFTQSLCSSIRANSDYGSSHEGDGKKVLLEHTSINPNASPHIGRSRNAIIGDCIARLLRFQGYDLEIHYYVNDMGKQIALLVMECKEKSDLKFDEVLQIYVTANKKAEEDVAYEASAFDLLKRFEDGDSEIAAQFKRITDICIEGQLQILGRLGIHYDFFDRESSFAHAQDLEDVIQNLRSREALFEDDEGRYVIDLKKLGFEREEGRYFVIRRANGSSLYGYRDIAYNLYKCAQNSFRNIVVLGEDHKLYSEQLQVILQALDRRYPDIIYYSYVLLREGKMSTRRGTVVLLNDLINEAVSRAKKTVGEVSSFLPEEEQKEIAEKVAVGAIKFSLLKTSPVKNVTFDWEDALSFVGDTGPYLQYSCARISSICRKYGKEVEEISGQPFSIEDSEWELILSLSFLEDVVDKALKEGNPSVLASYALEVAQRFNLFYHNCPVLNVKQEEIMILRLNICLATRRVLENLLSLLGIEAPERM